MSSLSNLLVPAVLFFALGFFTKIIKSDLRMPQDMAKMISIYLLIAIGLHGGYELGHADIATAINSAIAALAMGFLFPVIGYLLLVATGKVDRLNAAAIAAHYGSVSAGTFLTGIAFLDTSHIEYESYPLIMLAIMESPAIMVGLVLAAWARSKMNNTQTSSAEQGETLGWRQLVHEAFTNGSVVLLLGSMLIGAISSDTSMQKLHPFISDIFMGALCLFLFDMGLDAARRIKEFKKVGPILVGFGILMPLLGGLMGIAIGHWFLGFGVGGTTLVAVLGASASYIAVPPAMRLAVPEANPSFYLTLSLGVTFPFNVVVGIPLYFNIASGLAA